MEDQNLYNYLDQENHHKLRRKKAKPLNGMQTLQNYYSLRQFETIWLKFHHVQDYDQWCWACSDTCTIWQKLSNGPNRVDGIASAKNGGSFSVKMVIVIIQNKQERHVIYVLQTCSLNFDSCACNTTLKICMWYELTLPITGNACTYIKWMFFDLSQRGFYNYMLQDVWLWYSIRGKRNTRSELSWHTILLKTSKKQVT